MYKALITILTIIFSLPAISQTIIRGKLVDAISRQPLESALIQETGNENKKTLTDHYGNFSISVTSNTATLSASYIGYKSSEMQLNGSKEVIFELQSDVINLEDIVVTQNSTQQKFNSLAKMVLI